MASTKEGCADGHSAVWLLSPDCVPCDAMLGRALLKCGLVLCSGHWTVDTQCGQTRGPLSTAAGSPGQWAGERRYVGDVATAGDLRRHIVLAHPLRCSTPESHPHPHTLHHPTVALLLTCSAFTSFHPPHPTSMTSRLLSKATILTPTARLAMFRRTASLTHLATLRPALCTLSPTTRSFSSSSSLLSSPPLPPPSIRYPTPISTSTSSVSPLPDTYFACNVFDRRTLKKYLTANDFTRYVDTITSYRPIDAATADSVASALLRWATERGVTHYTHWFQPITGAGAEKHDTFIDVLRDGETPLLRFTGKQVATTFLPPFPHPPPSSEPLISALTPILPLLLLCVS